MAVCEVFARTVLCVDNFWKIKFSLGDFWRVHDTLWAGRCGSFVGAYQGTTYLNLVAECVIFARTVCFVDNFLGNQISFCDCRTGHDSPWAGRDGSFVGTYQTTTYSNLVAECEISARAVFYVENFGIIKNFFGWFLNISQYPWAQNCGSIIGICQSST